MTTALRVLAFGLLAILVGIAAAGAAEGPGSIIRVWPLEGGGRAGADAFRILYRSTGMNGEPIEVSGVVFIPQGAAPPEGRPVIAWAHPTTGIVRACAPSEMPDGAGMIWNLREMMDRGYVVAATDYPGLGAPGLHPYLIGISEARAVIDSVRAVRDLPDARAGERFAVWGHSQGGHAALFTGEIASAYAPELTLVGVAAAAPATYLAELFDDDIGTPTGKMLTAMTLYSWSKLFGLRLGGLVAEEAMPAFEKTAEACMESLSEFEAIDQDELPLQSDFLEADPTKLEAWRAIMDRNTPGREPAGVPVFLAQGLADTVVHPDITARFMKTLCRQGTKVDYEGYPGVSHGVIARDAAGDAIAWITARFEGAPAHNDCR